jgi:hypothetical protein
MYKHSKLMLVALALFFSALMSAAANAFRVDHVCHGGHGIA